MDTELGSRIRMVQRRNVSWDMEPHLRVRRVSALASCSDGLQHPLPFTPVLPLPWGTGPSDLLPRAEPAKAMAQMSRPR